MDINAEIAKARKAEDSLKEKLSTLFNQKTGTLPDFIESIKIAGFYERMTRNGVVKGMSKDAVAFHVALTRNLSPDEEKLCPKEHEGYDVKYAMPLRGIAYRV